MKTSFNEYKLNKEIMKAIDMLNFKEPTMVQKQVLPLVLEKKDIIVKSQTGSGKTAAFAIPICNLIEWEDNKPQALVITPTRELAIQVKEDIFNIGRFQRTNVVAIFGKYPFAPQVKQLKQKTHIVVGTPGRIIDHIEKETFDTSNIKYLIIDEADEILNMGFIEQIKVIIDRLPQDHTTMLFSATMPEAIKSLANQYMKNPVNVEIKYTNRAIDRIAQEKYVVEETDKLSLLRDITIFENADSCIIFCNTQQKVDDVYVELKRLNYTCQKMHGGMEQKDRLEVINSFKKGSFRYLVATDVAARGIDIDNISLVINFDIPQDKDNYIHRIGRTGRIENKGKAISFSTKRELRLLDAIEDHIAKKIPLKVRPTKDSISDLKDNFFEKMYTIPEEKEAKGTQLNKEIMKLHINAGKKTKMRAVDIVGTICSIEGVTAQDIGIINIIDISTFVEILNNKGEIVYQALQTKPIKGRIRRVSKKDDTYIR
ncbi:MAG: DEAD/DEAH box helicase [Bacilli bacterium]|nr:DEAD/DEAH box helicase [Bacilli bacterium]